MFAHAQIELTLLTSKLFLEKMILKVLLIAGSFFFSKNAHKKSAKMRLPFVRRLLVIRWRVRLCVERNPCIFFEKNTQGI